MYIEAYGQQGIHIDTLVPQNEPGFQPNGYFHDQDDDHHNYLDVP